MEINPQLELLHKFYIETRQPEPDHIAKLKKEWTGRDGRPKSLVLDYVGHADATDILLEHDPAWNWGPPTREELDLLGFPQALIRDKDGWARGLWIALTVHGHRRLGFGTCEAGKADAIKELIGDAIRNASMRFGLALALWSKAEWDDEPPTLSQAGPEVGVGEPQADSQSPASRHGVGAESPTPYDFRPLIIACRELQLTDDLRHKIVSYLSGDRTQSVKEMTEEEVRKFKGFIGELKEGVIPRVPNKLQEAIAQWREQLASETKTPTSSS